MKSGDQWDITQKENSASPMPSRNQLQSNHTAPTRPIKNTANNVDSDIPSTQPDSSYQCETAAAYLLELSGENNLRNNAEIDAITADNPMNGQTNYYARQVSLNGKKNHYNNSDDQSIGSATASELTAASNGQSSIDDKTPNHEQAMTEAPVNSGKHARSRSKDFVEAYRRQRNQLAPAVIHIPRRNHPESNLGSYAHNGFPNGGASYDGEAQTVSSLLSAGHKMPPPGYNPEARYLRAIRQVPVSTGINAINRPQSAELDQYETEDSEDDSDEVDDLDHFLNESQEDPDNDPWLKKWKYNDPEVCCICLGEGADQNNAFVYCDNPQCEVIVHKECYGIKKLPGRNDVWLCDRCKEQKENPAAVIRCAVCPSPHGALRRLGAVHQHLGWIHVVCGTWMPNVQISDVKAVTGFDIREIPEKSWNYKCFLCPDPVSASHGACVRCDAHGCKKTFHISCAQKFSLLEEAEETENLTDPYFTYCLDHSSYNQGEPKLNGWEKWVRQRDRYLLLKNEECAEQRSAALWKRAQSITKGNDHATSELIRAGFGFRELASDRYAFFAKEMADTIASSQSGIFQLEAQNFQLEEAISKMDSNLKDASHKIKRAEKRKVELQKEINKVKSLVAKEELAEKKRLELERMEDARMKKTARVEKRKAELQKEIAKVTAEIAKEDRGYKRKLSYPNDLGPTSTKRFRETSDSSLTHLDRESTRSTSPRLTRNKEATTFSFPPIISSLFDQFGSRSTNAEQEKLNSPTSASSNINPSPTSSAVVEQLLEPNSYTNEQTASVETEMPFIAHETTISETDAASPHDTNVHIQLSRAASRSGHHSEPEDHFNSSDIVSHPDHIKPVRARTLDVMTKPISTQRRISSEQGYANHDEDILKAAKAAIKNGKMLLKKAQLSQVNSKSQGNESNLKPDKPTRVMGLLETLNSVLGSPKEVGETVLDDLEPLYFEADEETVETELDNSSDPFKARSTEIDTDVSETAKLSNGQTLESTPTSLPVDHLSSSSKSPENRRSDVSPYNLRSLDSAFVGEASLSQAHTAAEPYQRYRSFVRVSPFVPDKQVEVSLQYTPWLSKHLRANWNDSFDANSNDIVTEYIPVLDDEENTVPSTQGDSFKNGEIEAKANKRKRASHGSPSVEAALPSSLPSQSDRTIQSSPERPMTTSSLSPQRETVFNLPFRHRLILPRPNQSVFPQPNEFVLPRPDHIVHDQEQMHTQSSSSMMLRLPTTSLRAPSSYSSPAEQTDEINVQAQEKKQTDEMNVQPQENKQTDNMNVQLQENKQREDVRPLVAKETVSNDKRPVNGHKPVKKLEKQRSVGAPITRAATSNAKNPATPAKPDTTTPTKRRQRRSLVRKPTPPPSSAVCAECRKKEIPMRVANDLGVSAQDMRHLISIRPTKKPGHTGQGKDWDPGVLVQCDSCHKYYHCGCTSPPIRNYPERGVQFRCLDCDVVKIIYPEVDEVLHMNRDELEGDKKSLRERKAINYHE